MKLSFNPFNRGNPMTLKDAAIVATLTALAIWILNFLANATIGMLREDIAAFCFEAVKSYMVNWAGTFITLAGLERFVSKGKEKPKS